MTSTLAVTWLKHFGAWGHADVDDDDIRCREQLYEQVAAGGILAAKPTHLEP